MFLVEEDSLPLTINLFLISGYLLFSTHFFRYVILQNSWLNLSLLKLLPRILFFTFLLSVSNYIFQIISGFFLNTLDYGNDFEPIVILTTILTFMILYVLWVSLYFIYHYFEKYNTTLKYEAAIYEFELNKLKSQLNPHFIFNALNSIRALVDEDPVKSKRAITQLSNILRNSLIMNKRKLIDFNDELKTVRDYLELESIRLEERLKINIDISRDVETYQIPPLMLQTLVENGIKHGVATLTKGGEITIKAWEDKQKLKIQIRNSGQYINGSNVKKGTGYGIDSTKQRLSLIYGQMASFNIKNENSNTVLTEISIPQNI